MPEEMEALSALWRRVLGKEHVGIDDDFFALGGDPQLAIKLLDEINKLTGLLFSPLVIYQAPTVAALAALLKEPSATPFPKQILLKSGNSESPLYLAHGLCGNIMEFFEFVKHLKCSRPIYGLQARGTDGLEEPCTSIDEMAAYHCDAIKKIQPRGPYLLVGYSLGGLVALEMARLFSQNGEGIALLVMIDSYPPLRYAPLRQQLGAYSRRAKRYALRLLRPAQVPSSLGRAFTPAMRRVEQAAAKALREYHPRYYPGRIRFVKATIPVHFPDDPEKVWTSSTDRLELEAVPGDHHQLLTAQCARLAAVISRYLDELPLDKRTGSITR